MADAAPCRAAYRRGMSSRTAPAARRPGDPAAAWPQGRWGHVWGEAWRVLAAAAIGLFGWFGVWALVETENRAGPLDWLAIGDPAVGILSLGLLLLRRRWPLTITLVLVILSGFVVTAGGSAALATVSLATHRRWRPLLVVGPVFLLTAFTWDLLFPPPEPGIWTAVMNLGVQALLMVTVFAVGYSIGVRRESVAALRERVETAEREQELRVEQARATERSRIAREMHDVLAHRISLIAMNAGVLSYRADLPPEQVREIAGTLRDDADQAVSELREVLGVLRGTGEPEQPRGPQPDLRHLEELFAEVTEGGTRVVHSFRMDPGSVPETISRHAYRIVQEGLTNARKHAPGQPVTVSLAGGAGVGLDLTVVNQPARYGDTPSEDSVRRSGSGLGLLGLAERAVLSGGQLSYGTDRSGRFVVRAWLPWTDANHS